MYKIHGLVVLGLGELKFSSLKKWEFAGFFGGGYHHFCLKYLIPATFGGSRPLFEALVLLKFPYERNPIFGVYFQFKTLN